jgi:hypothetical protein
VRNVQKAIARHALARANVLLSTRFDIGRIVDRSGVWSARRTTLEDLFAAVARLPFTRELSSRVVGAPFCRGALEPLVVVHLGLVKLLIIKGRIPLIYASPI